jgi:hypothetical protein
MGTTMRFMGIKPASFTPNAATQHCLELSCTPQTGEGRGKRHPVETAIIKGWPI